MIKVTVLYPAAEGARFDMDYYLASHMPLVESKMTGVIKGWTVDQGLNAGAPGTPPPFEVMTHMTFDDFDAFAAAFGEHAGEIMTDIPNFTDISPQIQVSEVRA